VEDLSNEDLKQLILYYKQRANDLEFSNLQLQLKNKKLLSVESKPRPATKITKTKSE